LPANADRPSRLTDGLAFRSQVVLGAIGLAAACAAVLTALGSVHRSARGANQVAVLGQSLTYPAINLAAAILLVLAALGGVVLATIVRGAWRQLRDHRRFARGIPILGHLPGHPGVSVIDESDPQAFCAGYLRPRVYISRGALGLLDGDELTAVVSHENRHRRTRDPLRLALGRLLSDALFFMPAMRPLGDRYAQIAEYKADEAAVRASDGEPAPLASALLAFEAASPPGVASISNERVDALLGHPPGWRLPSPLLGLSLVTVCSLVVLVWRTAGVASAHATFNLPVLSSQPCMLVLALLPAAVILAAHACRRRLTRSPQTRWAAASA
jgi:Zn-dependent protease with chaperone function